MPTFDEYINSLEGKGDIDPLAVARDLHELHTHEVTTREAKIEQLNGSIAEKDAAISARDQEVTKYKAMNLDLVMQIPGNQTHDDPAPVEGEKPSGASIKISDLFTPEVRKRHGL